LSYSLVRELGARLMRGVMLTYWSSIGGFNKINRLIRGKATNTALLRGYPEFTVLDMDFDEFVNPGIIRPLLLNIYWDAVILLDRSGRLQDFLDHVRRRIIESGLRRVKDGKAYYWILPKPIAKVRIL